MKLTTALVTIVISSALPAWGATDPVGDSIANSWGYTADLISASVEASPGLLRLHVGFDGDRQDHSFQVNLDIDQDASTGFPGVWGYPDNSISDGSLGTEYVVRWDSSTTCLSVRQWSGSAFLVVYFDSDVVEPFLGESFGVSLALLGGDDGLMNYKIIAKEPGGASNEFVLLDVMPDAGLPAATSTLVPEPNGVSLILAGILFLGLNSRGRHSCSRPACRTASTVPAASRILDRETR